jgi:hypothetical protein
MGHRIGRPFWTSAAITAAMIAAVPASALPLHLPGHRPKVVVPTEGPWFVRAGQVQDIYANTGKKPVALQAAVCLTPGSGGDPHVNLLQGGRPPIELQGCQSLYLELSPGDHIALADTGSTDAAGTYKFDLQGQLK